VAQLATNIAVSNSRTERNLIFESLIRSLSSCYPPCKRMLLIDLKWLFAPTPPGRDVGGSVTRPGSGWTDGKPGRSGVAEGLGEAAEAGDSQASRSSQRAPAAAAKPAANSAGADWREQHRARVAAKIKGTLRR
jgi:hypothetical protein